MSIEKSIQNLIKAIQQPTRYMGDEPSIKVVPKPGTDPCLAIFKAAINGVSTRERRKDIAAGDICKVVKATHPANTSAPGYCQELVNQNSDAGSDCPASDMFKDVPGMDKATIITYGEVESACNAYAFSVVSATAGISEIEKREIERKAKCACYQHAIYAEPALPNGTIPEVPGLNVKIFPKHTQKQILAGFYGGCKLSQLRAMCNTNSRLIDKFLNNLGCTMPNGTST